LLKIVFKGEAMNSTDDIQRPDVRQIDRESREKLNELVDVKSLPTDPYDRMEATRQRLRNIRHTTGLVNRRTQREAIQTMACELLKAEHKHVQREIEKAEMISEKTHKAWVVQLQGAWLDFLKKVKAEEAIKKQNFMMDWMELCNRQRDKVEANQNLKKKQKDKALDVIDNDEDEMISEIEEMARKMVEMNENKP